MIRRFNYTKRLKINSGDISITVREVSGSTPVAAVSAKLNSYSLPDDADVFIEAYRKASYQRYEFGTVRDHPEQKEFELSEFPSPEGVLFRVKVVGLREDLKHDAPVLLAAADRISPREGGDSDSDYDRLLRLVPADLGGEIWRIDLEDGPVLHIERTFWDDRSFVRSGWFFSLVVPTVLRVALTAALADGNREFDDPEDWRSRWVRFALMIPGEPDLPGMDEDVSYWVDSRVATFSRQKRMLDRFSGALKGEQH